MADALPAVVGLLALLFAPAVDRWWERFDAWVEGKHHRHRPKLEVDRVIS